MLFSIRCQHITHSVTLCITLLIPSARLQPATKSLCTWNPTLQTPQQDSRLQSSLYIHTTSELPQVQACNSVALYINHPPSTTQPDSKLELPLGSYPWTPSDSSLWISHSAHCRPKTPKPDVSRWISHSVLTPCQTAQPSPNLQVILHTISISLPFHLQFLLFSPKWLVVPQSL